MIDHPLLVLKGDPQCTRRARALLEAYTACIEDVKATAKALTEQQSQDAARRLVSRMLILDIAFIHMGEEFTAVAAPTHPFHLWRWIALAELLDNNKEELQGIGEEALEPLVTDPPAACPQIVVSPYALTQMLDRPHALIPIGSFSSLPLFAEPTSRQIVRFRARSFVKIAERLIRLMPHAALGLRVALIDPPSVGGAVEDLLELVNPFDDEAGVPAHILVLRTRSAPEATDEEEDELANLTRELRN